MIDRRGRDYKGWAVRVFYPPGPDNAYSGLAGVGLIDPMLLVSRPVVRTALFSTRATARDFAAEMRRQGWHRAQVERVRVTIEPVAKV